MSEELKPCPFCNGEATYGTACGEVWARCSECMSESPLCSSYTEARTAWNTRASQPVSVSAWVKCSDRMPVHGTTYGENMWVLTNGPGMSRPRLLNWCAANGGHWRNEEDDRCYVDVTHWQPLPAPPAALSGDGEGV